MIIFSLNHRSNRTGLVIESESNNSDRNYESSSGEIEEKESIESDEISSFSLSNSDFDELGFS